MVLSGLIHRSMKRHIHLNNQNGLQEKGRYKSQTSNSQITSLVTSRGINLSAEYTRPPIKPFPRAWIEFPNLRQNCFKLSEGPQILSNVGHRLGIRLGTEKIRHRPEYQIIMRRGCWSCVSLSGGSHPWLWDWIPIDGFAAKVHEDQDDRESRLITQWMN